MNPWPRGDPDHLSFPSVPGKSNPATLFAMTRRAVGLPILPNGGDRSRHLRGSTVQKRNPPPMFCTLLARRRYPKRVLDTLDHRIDITGDFAATEKIKSFLTTKTRTCAGGSTYMVASGYQGHLHAAE